MKRKLFGLLVVALILVSCQPQPRWNVVIVTFDTTRADHIGCYGHDAIQTPTLDGLAAEGVLFENAYSSIPITLPSHSSLMTGKVPFAHGVRDNGIFNLGEEQTTLAEVLLAEGYRTGAAIGAFPLIGDTGIGQGFEFFDDHLTSAYEDIYGDRIFPKERLFFDERPAARVNEAILPWLEENHQEPFFLWAHYFDPHLPHEPPAPFDDLYAHELYDGEIAYSDESLGTLIEHLRRLGVYDRTLIVFTSDHGEGRGEHKEETHSLLVYNSTLHVPLIMKPPLGAKGFGVPGQRVTPRVGTVDVLPTILEALGLALPEDVQGESLLPLLAPDSPQRSRREVYAETLSPRITRNWGEQRALFLGDYKYIHGPNLELYDLASDPKEIDNLVEEKPEIARSLQKKLSDYLAENAVEGLDASVAIDEETARRLQALGYLQSSGSNTGPIEEKLTREGSPPQDHVQEVDQYSLAKNYLFQGKLTEGRDILEDLLSRDPDNPHYLELLVSVEMRARRYEQALAILERLEAMDVGYPPPEQVLESTGRVLLAQGKVAEALERFQKAQDIQESTEGQYRLARIHQGLRDAQAVQRHLERALELDETFLPAKIDLAIRHAVAGDLEKAEQLFRQAVNEHPYHDRSLFNYGAFLVQSEKLEEALDYFQRAVEVRGNYVEALYALVETHLRLGQREAAFAAFDALERTAPQSQHAELARRLLENPS